MTTAQPPTPRTLLAATCVLQFLVWFKPSQQYFIPVVSDWFHVSVEDVTGVLFVHSLYAPFLVFPLLTAAYRFGGYATALSLTTAAAAASPALIIFGAPHFTAAVLSQWTWALHFAALFATVGMLYSWLPPAWYLPAAAANTATMLAASTASSAVGLTMAHAQTHTLGLTFYGTLASALAGCAWLGVALGAGWLPPPSAQPMPPLPCLSRPRRAPGATAPLLGPPPLAVAPAPGGGPTSVQAPPAPCRPPPAMHALLTVPRIWRWVVPAFMMRAVHTLVIELWPALVATHYPNLQLWNGAVGLAAHVAAAAAVGMATRVQALRSTRVTQYVVVAATAAAAVLLLLLGWALHAGLPATPGLLTLATLVTGHNLAAEIALAIASAATAREVFRVLVAGGQVAQGGADGSNSIIGAMGGGQWALVLGMQALLAEAWQLAVQFTLWPRGVWPLPVNPWALHLTYTQQFMGLGAFAGMAAVTALCLHGTPLELLALRTGGCCCCRPQSAQEEPGTPPAQVRKSLLQDALCPGAWVWFAQGWK